MSPIPRDRTPDSTLAFARDGYEFVSRRSRRHRSAVFETRLLGTRTICMLGEDAARVFYDPDRFQRDGGTPARVRKTLIGLGGVQGLDGETHRSRKRMLMSLMTPEAIDQLTALTAKEWHERIDRWEHTRETILYDEVARLLCRDRAVRAGGGPPHR